MTTRQPPRIYTPPLTTRMIPSGSPMPREHSRIEIPWRDSFLLEGPLSALAQWYDDLGLDAIHSVPALVRETSC